jgi:hypothetical protein
MEKYQNADELYDRMSQRKFHKLPNCEEINEKFVGFVFR